MTDTDQAGSIQVPAIDPREVHAERVAGRSTVYLDNNIWIDLRDAETPEAAGCRDACVIAVELGQALFPVSWASVGELFEIPHPEKELPESALKFWAKANKFAADLGRRLGGRYLQINFDHLCQDPDQTINDIIAFLGIDVKNEIHLAARELPKTPSSLGRYKDHDISLLDPEDLAVLNEFGFSIEE